MDYWLTLIVWIKLFLCKSQIDGGNEEECIVFTPLSTNYLNYRSFGCPSTLLGKLTRKETILLYSPLKQIFQESFLSGAILHPCEERQGTQSSILYHFWLQSSINRKPVLLDTSYDYRILYSSVISYPRSVTRGQSWKRAWIATIRVLLWPTKKAEERIILENWNRG